MAKNKLEKVAAQKRQKLLMKKRTKNIARHKTQGAGVVSENAIQHQMLGQFGSVNNFIRNVQHLASLFATEEELKPIRFDANAIYAKLDASDPKTNAALADIYTNDDFTYYSQDYEEFWKNTREKVLPEFITADLTERLTKLFKILLQKKRGYKKDFRAMSAGNLLLQSHVVALKEAPVESNNLWEIIFNATLKENKIALPAPVEPPVAPPETPAESAGAPAAVSPVEETPSTNGNAPVAE